MMTNKTFAAFPRFNIRAILIALVLFSILIAEAHTKVPSFQIDVVRDIFQFATYPFTPFTPPDTGISINNVSINEGNAGTRQMDFVVSLSQPSQQTVTVSYSTSDGTATAGIDYAAITPATLTFNPNETIQIVSVTINGDSSAELDETLNLHLSNPTNATILDNLGIGTIHNDDGGLVVNSFAQSPGANGDCTLGEAIHAANSNQTVDGCVVGDNEVADTILLPAGTYTLAAADHTEGIFGTSNGLPLIVSPITIQGAGAASTIIQRSSAAGIPEFRFFQVGVASEVGRLTLNDLTLKNGRTPSYGAGAIFPSGVLTINNCHFENNSTGSGGAGGGVIGSSFGYTAIINNSTFTGNTSGGVGGAIGTPSDLTLTNSTFTNNTAAVGGGAIGSATSGVATVSGSTFSNNSVTGDGAGGAIRGDTINISNSIFNGNSASNTGSNSNGGAISGNTVAISNSTISGGTAGGTGGGVFGTNVTVTDSTVSGNNANRAGGVHASHLTINNSTISGNFAKEHGGGIVFAGSGGSLSVNNATITNNTADSNNDGNGRGGGIGHTYSFSASQTMNIRNSIIAGNINNSAPDCGAEFGHAILSQGYNLIGNSTGCNFTSAPGDQVGTSATPINPLLGALQNHGGAGKTHGLLANSPAIDNASPAPPDGTGNSCLPTDPRGAPRPADGDGNGTARCDIGAFEVVELVPTRLAFSIQPTNRIAGQVFNPAIKVEIQDQFGILMPNETADVIIALGNNPGGSTLSGTLTRATVSGIATFDDVYLDRVGTAYTLQASFGSLTTATSGAFNITPGAASQLAFETQPGNTPVLTTITPAIVVSLQDAFGNLVTNQSRNITISIGSNPGNGTLSGNVSANTGSSGFVTFNSLSIDQPAAGYKLQAATSGLPPKLSDEFEITRAIFVVTKTADTSDGKCNSDCSLREAITAANAMNGADTINFNISGTPPFTIALGSTLPDISSPVTIDGKTQSGYVNSPIVGINGSAIGQSANGITLAAGGNTIQGLLIGGFGSTNNSHAIRIQSNNNVIKGNYIGTDFTGNSSLSNSVGIGTDSGSTSNTIGGTATADRNVISGNTVAGIRIASSGNTVQGNYLGRNASNNGAVGNGFGIELLSGASTNAIGGTAQGAGNIIFGNTSGIAFSSSPATKNSIRGNSIYGNSGAGIVLSKNSPTQNDPKDPDAGPNNLQNYPVLSLAVSSGGNTNVRGILNSTSDATFTLEFFSNQTCDASGYGEGRTLLGTTTVTTDRSGITSFDVNLATTVTPGHFITATATDAVGNTSEFSDCEQVGSVFSTISGRVVGASDRGLHNTLVGLHGERTATTVTDRNGNYSFAGLPVGDYAVAPFLGNYSFSPPNRTYTSLSVNQTDQDFVGTRSRYAVTVVVKANRAGSLHALGQVNLTVSGDANQSKQSDANGKAIFNLPLAGNYVITPSLANYAFNPSSINLPGPLTNDLTVDFTAQLQTPLIGRFVAGTGSWVKTLNADGSSSTQLSSLGSGGAQYPDLSRDGSQIVLGSQPRLYAASFDGTNRTSLTSATDGTPFYPRWAPDKSKITYVYQRNSSAVALMLNVAGGTTTNIPPGRFRRTWSPDSMKIAFERRLTYSSEIFSANVDGTNEVQLTNYSSGYNIDPDWSPDGTKIVFVRAGRSIIVMKADGSNKTTLYTLTDPDLEITNTVWSPDGNKIAFYFQKTSEWNNPVGKGLYVINADGNGLMKISSDRGSSLSWGAEYQVPTSQGVNIPVQSGGVSLNFAGISNAGQTTVSPIPSNSAGTVQGGFQIYAMAYEISTTAAYTPPITVCFSPVPYDSEAHFNTLALLHNEGGTLVDRTISRNFAAKQICGSVNSLSPFVLAEQIDLSKPQISGLVLDSNGNPMSGVQMSLTGEETKETETDTDGTFRFVNLTAGTNYNVQPKQLGYVFNSYSQDFVNLADEETILFTGTANSFAVGGRVTDANGAGISDVPVELTGALTADTLTDANGNYTFPDLPADGSFRVRAFNGVNDYSPFEITVDPLLSSVTDIDFTQLGPTTPTAANGTVSGRVLDDSGAPVAGVVLNLSGTQNRKTISNTDGNYQFANVETTGFYTITPARVNYTFNPFNRSFSQLGNQTEAAFTASPSSTNANPLNTPEYFVRQHYLDFLGREPDEAGFNFWSDQMLECGVDVACIERRRINVSAAYFLSIEFQETGGFVDGLYKASYGRRPLYAEFIPDTAILADNIVVGQENWQQRLVTNKETFIQSFITRATFQQVYDGLSNEAYVDKLIAHTKVAFDVGERDALVDGLNNNSLTRAKVLWLIAENDGFAAAKRNETFVMMEYFGYLRRDPDESGHQFWLNKLNQFEGDFERAEMVKAFISSVEYRQRFGP